MSFDIFKDIISSIYTKSGNVFEIDPVEAERVYNPWIVNMAMSMHDDTLYVANIVNQFHMLPKRMQYDFYYSAITPGKRYSKWVKPEKIDNLDLVKKAFNYSDAKARQALKVLTQDQIKKLKELENVGIIPK